MLNKIPKIFVVTLIIFVTMCSTLGNLSLAMSSSSENSITNENQEEIIIKFKKGTEKTRKNKIKDEMSLSEEVMDIENLDTKVIKLPKGKKLEDVKGLAKKYGEIEYVEPNYEAEFLYMPNDPGYKNLSAVLTAIGAQTGWDITKGESVVVAVVDSGVAVHPDLPTLLPGYSAITSLSPNNDKVGHGTGVAGVIGAVRR